MRSGLLRGGGKKFLEEVLPVFNADGGLVQSNAINEGRRSTGDVVGGTILPEASDEEVRTSVVERVSKVLLRKIKLEGDFVGPDVLEVARGKSIIESADLLPAVVHVLLLIALRSIVLAERLKVREEPRHLEAE
eukprot:CAMPEP_0170494248 /NCGR_PEP_ID=MMETSP0208-20121228/14535_1 /TAXON_ID=197538 /ORGANISM="Strombidium inclinatum, Strain S3" /LENGTH=133 /DNA_ID=CAMNT_0010770279 /DNA_START=35 /DNA_END=436 /DNA_ORIENTATION=+